MDSDLKRALSLKDWKEILNFLPAIRRMKMSSICIDDIRHYKELESLGDYESLEAFKPKACIYMQAFSGLYHPICRKCCGTDPVFTVWLLAVDKRHASTGIYFFGDNPNIGKGYGPTWNYPDLLRFYDKSLTSGSIASRTRKKDARRTLLNARLNGADLSSHDMQDLETHVMSNGIIELSDDMQENIRFLRSLGLYKDSIQFNKVKLRKKQYSAKHSAAKLSKYRKQQTMLRDAQALKTGDTKSLIQNIKLALEQSRYKDIPKKKRNDQLRNELLAIKQELDSE